MFALISPLPRGRSGYGVNTSFPPRSFSAGFAVAVACRDGRGAGAGGGRDTLDVAGVKVRLFGVDAPELDQPCERGGRRWACGRAAREELAGIVGRKRLVCAVQDVDRYGRAVAVCEAGGEDLGALMVRRGMAVAYLRYSARYANAEAAARAEGLGLWAAEWVVPAGPAQTWRLSSASVNAQLCGCMPRWL